MLGRTTLLLNRISRVVFRKSFIVVSVLVIGGYELATHPPIESVEHGQAGIRMNRFIGSATPLGEGAVLMIPGLHELRRYSLQDQTYHPEQSSKANGAAPFQSSGGLSLGVDLTIRYALDPNKFVAIWKNLP